MRKLAGLPKELTKRGLPRCAESETADAVSPLLLGAGVLDVLVHGGADEDGDQGEVPRGNEHHRYAQQGAEHRQ